MLEDNDERVEALLLSRQSLEKTTTSLLESFHTGSSWPKCHKKHEEARNHIRTFFNEEARQGKSSTSTQIHTHHIIVVIKLRLSV